jgi:polyhydroxyalkanoate synthesis regulator phasin
MDKINIRFFNKHLKKLTSKFVKLGSMNKEQKKQWDKLLLRNNSIGEKFRLIKFGRNN